MQKYKLEAYKGMKTRYKCPYCNHKGKFSRYINTETGEHLADHVGRCERLDSCGVNYTPKQYFEENNASIDSLKQKTKIKLKIIEPKSEQISFIPTELLTATLRNYESNNFIKFLIELFGVEITNQLVNRYFIGTSKKWPGASIFWQVDLRGNVRSGKIMLYHEKSGKRIRKPFDHITWVHKGINQREYFLKQCLFGEHLLDESKTVVIVESEKTAIISSVYFPQFTWVAVGSVTDLSAEKCIILKGRTVVLFPDLSKPKSGELTAFEKWSKKAKDFKYIAKFAVSDLLERNATEEERKQGLDLADYLIRFNYKEFNLEPSKPPLIKEIIPELKPNQDNQKIQNRLIPAYVSETGELYIETPIGTTYTIYPSIDHYNNRLCLPDFIDKDKISIVGFKVVQINLDLLKIILNED